MPRRVSLISRLLQDVSCAAAAIGHARAPRTRTRRSCTRRRGIIANGSLRSSGRRSPLRAIEPPRNESILERPFPDGTRHPMPFFPELPPPLNEALLLGMLLVVGGVLGAAAQRFGLSAVF